MNFGKFVTLLALATLSLSVSAHADWQKVLSCSYSAGPADGLVVDIATYVRGIAGHQLVIRDEKLVKALVATGSSDICFKDIVQPNDKGEIIVLVQKDEKANFIGTYCGRGRGLALIRVGDEYKLRINMTGLQPDLDLTCSSVN